ncbi:MAG: phosphate ABC transporter substrate-binding protein [Symploca sp. SIO3C6]|nr:phosphate ABC transporter substrate-binding protein [Symploca sp. SIO3C6]
MSQKNETTVLTLTILITLGLLGICFWLFSNKFNFQPGSINLNQPELTQQFNKVDTFSKVQNVPSGLFNYGGSTSWAPIRRDVDPIIQVSWLKFRLRYTQSISNIPGSGTAIKMLLNNQLAFAQSSRPLKQQEYQEALQKGFTLKEIPVAIDGIAIAVNPNLPVSGLTIAQLQQIYLGKLTNWNQVGGPNLPIVAYSRPLEAGGTVEFFVENVLNGEDFGNKIKLIDTTTQALRKVAQEAGSIYYASAPEVVPQCSVKSLPIGRTVDELVPPYQEPFIALYQCPSQRNQLNIPAFRTGEYPITRRLFVIVKENGQVDQQAGLAYANLLLTTQGQDLLTKAGFVSLR